MTLERIAESRIMIDQARLLTLKAAYMMDTVGNKAARAEIAMIKVAAPAMACQVIDWAIQAHGGAGVCDDFGLARAYAHARTLRLADGPDEVHRNQIGRLELAKYSAVTSRCPTGDILSRDFGDLAELIRTRAAERPSGTALLEDERRLDYAELDILDGSRCRGAATRRCTAARVHRDLCREFDRIRRRIPRRTACRGRRRAAVAVEHRRHAREAWLPMRGRATSSSMPPRPTRSKTLATRSTRAASPCPAVERRWNNGSCHLACAPSPLPSSRIGRSTSSIHPERRGCRRASCNRTPCAGRTCSAARCTRYAQDAITLLSTPLYSNTTLVSFFPTLAMGGAVLLMAKFDAQRYLTLAESHRVTHTMLVPVQYQRILAQR